MAQPIHLARESNPMFRTSPVLLFVPSVHFRGDAICRFQDQEWVRQEPHPPIFVGTELEGRDPRKSKEAGIRRKERKGTKGITLYAVAGFGWRC